MSISKQLMTMLSIAILGIIAVFTIGIHKMEQVYKETNYCNINALPSITIMSDVMRNFYRIRVYAFEHMTTENKESMKQSEKMIKERKEALNKDFKSYEKLISDTKIKSYLITTKYY